MQSPITATLIVSSISLAFFHSLAPDHWVPFVALAKSSHWSRWKLVWVSFLAGLGHVISSLFIGVIGIALGVGLTQIQQVEVQRGAVVIWLLIGFGVAYTLWGFKHAQHPHPHLEMKDAVRLAAIRRVWTLFAVMVFGPCEPLVPLMFLAYHQGWMAIIFTSVIFSAVTVFMVVAQSLLSYMGFELIHSEILERHTHTIAGIVIVVTGIFVLLVGI